MIDVISPISSPNRDALLVIDTGNKYEQNSELSKTKSDETKKKANTTDEHEKNQEDDAQQNSKTTKPKNTKQTRLKNTKKKSGEKQETDNRNKR